MTIKTALDRIWLLTVYSKSARENISARVRLRTGMSQTKFAKMLGVSKRTIQEWEQGRRKPTGAAKSLLTVAEKRPDVLREIFLI